MLEVHYNNPGLIKGRSTFSTPVIDDFFLPVYHCRHDRQFRCSFVYNAGREKIRRRSDRIGLGVHRQNGYPSESTRFHVERILYSRMHRCGINFILSSFYLHTFSILIYIKYKLILTK